MGWYDPPDDIVKTKEATIWESEFSVIANMQVLATKEDDLDQLITENLAEKFDAGWFNIYDMEASVEDKKEIEEYPDGRVLYQCEVVIWATCYDFEWECPLSYEDGEPEFDYSEVDYEVNNEYTNNDGTGISFDNAQDIVDPKCKFMKVLSLTYNEDSYHRIS